MENMYEHNMKREELFIQLAISTVGLNAIERKVGIVRARFEQMNGMTATPATGVVRKMSFSKIFQRIAAVLMILISSATVYKYVSVNNLTFYDRQFVVYELGTARGEKKPDLQAFSYQNANWLDVVAINHMAPVKTNKSRFLAGMAEMELKQYTSAVELFQTIMSNKTDESLRDEAEYYGALAYLANHQTGQALELINQIRANPDHKYYPLARNMSPIDLKIIELKK